MLDEVYQMKKYLDEVYHKEMKERRKKNQKKLFI